MLANAFERAAAIGRVTDLKAHTARGFIEDWRALFYFLADFGSAGIAHARTHDVVKRQVVLLKPGWVGMVIPGVFRTVARAAGVCQTPRSIDHSGSSFDSQASSTRSPGRAPRQRYARWCRPGSRPRDPRGARRD